MNHITLPARLVLPILGGVLLGAVTFGPDVEHRTQVYALTQGVSRLRWWTVKVVVTSAPAFVALALLGLATLWLVNASDDSVIETSRLTSPGFDFLDLLPDTRFLVAYAAASAAALIWRAVGGVVAGLIVAGVVVAGGTLLQPIVVPQDSNLIPVQLWLADTTGMLARAPGSSYGSSGYADSAGREVDVSNLSCDQAEFSDCLLASGVIYLVETYVSDSASPRMMLTISGLNVLFAGAFLGLGARGLRRRTARSAHHGGVSSSIRLTCELSDDR